MTLSLCPHRLASRNGVRVASRTVEDNASYAWRNAGDDWRCYQQLPADFVYDFRAELDKAATQIDESGTSPFGRALAEVWDERGYQIQWIEDGDAMQHRPHSPNDDTYGEVWDEAARRLDPYAVVFKARLDDELLRYAAAHTRGEHLERACAGLRPHAEQLRNELHARLDRHAETATSQRAEQQLDGWRALVDTAVTRAQLDQLATDIPA